MQHTDDSECPSQTAISTPQMAIHPPIQRVQLVQSDSASSNVALKIVYLLFILHASLIAYFISLKSIFYFGCLDKVKIDQF